MKDRARSLFAELQDEICSALEDLDGKARFREDRWSHSPAGTGPSGGGGATRVLDRGRVFEKAGVRLSDGRAFEGRGFMRLNFGCPRETLRKALDRIIQAVAEVDGSPEIAS